MVTRLRAFIYVFKMIFFTTVASRSLRIFFDPTGFAHVSQHAIFYAGFDKKYVDISKSFCVSRAYFGGLLASMRNLDIGLRAGYFRILHIKGIGFKVFQSLLRRSLYFFLGYNHITKYCVSKFVDFRPLKGHVLLFSPQKSFFGAALYQIRHLRFPDPYRGKGIRYRFQLIQFKPGKQR